MKHGKFIFLNVFLLSTTIVNSETIVPDGQPLDKALVIQALAPPKTDAINDDDADRITLPDCDPAQLKRTCRMIPSILTSGSDDDSKVKGHSSIIQPLKKHIDTQQALSLQINFAYNSADLTAESKSQLNPVGEALASGALNKLNFEVEGHTDAVGSDVYNNKLSAERATSVKSYLVNKFGISAKQISASGKGKLGLLDPSHPDSEVNRRVRIVASK
jgi:outer membrane protein OmpA-like peptidoglycan-associated protein